MDVFSASMLRLVGHLLSLGLIGAVICALFAARGRSFDMRYWRLLSAVLGIYALWFFMLSVSIRDVELLRRGEMTWLFGFIELAGAVGGWLWFGLTMLMSFQLPARKSTKSLVLKR